MSKKQKRFRQPQQEQNVPTFERRPTIDEIMEHLAKSAEYAMQHRRLSTFDAIRISLNILNMMHNGQVEFVFNIDGQIEVALTEAGRAADAKEDKA